MNFWKLKIQQHKLKKEKIYHKVEQGDKEMENRKKKEKSR